GKPKKEMLKDKKEQKQDMQEAWQQITTVVLPTLAVVVLLIVVFVYVAMRPAVTDHTINSIMEMGENKETAQCTTAADPEPVQ
ncbi:hypothetical protein A6R68_15882, partial [Neotoma lepida]